MVDYEERLYKSMRYSSVFMNNTVDSIGMLSINKGVSYEERVLKDLGNNDS